MTSPVKTCPVWPFPQILELSVIDQNYIATILQYSSKTNPEMTGIDVIFHAIRSLLKVTGQ